MPDYFLGVDPGKNGGFALIDESGNPLQCWDMPETDRDIFNSLCDIVEVCIGDQLFSAVEYISGGNYGAPTAALMKCDNNAGACRMALEIANWRPVLVRTKAWGECLKKLGIITPGYKPKDMAKQYAMTYARELVTGSKGGYKNGRGDALAIATWLWKTRQHEK